MSLAVFIGKALVVVIIMLLERFLCGLDRCRPARSVTSASLSRSI